MSDNEELLRKEQEHMQKVMDAANNRIQQEKEEEKVRELRAQEVIEESRKFHEGLVAKMKAREQKNERTRYKTELKRQDRVRKSDDAAMKALEDGRQLDSARAERTQTIEEQRAEREKEMRKQKLDFARQRAEKMKIVKKQQEQAELDRLVASNDLEARLADAEAHRGRMHNQQRQKIISADDKGPRRHATPAHLPTCPPAHLPTTCDLHSPVHAAAGSPTKVTKAVCRPASAEEGDEAD